MTTPRGVDRRGFRKGGYQIFENVVSTEVIREVRDFLAEQIVAIPTPTTSAKSAASRMQR